MPARNVRFEANVGPGFPAYTGSCGAPGITMDFNVWSSGVKCGTHDEIAPSGFVNEGALDFHLAPGSAVSPLPA